MKSAIHIIPLRLIKYSDSHSVLTAFSREHGRLSFLIPAGNGREVNRRRALLMPMSVVECVVEMRPGRDLHLMTSPRLVAPHNSLRMNPLKSAVAMFMAEFLSFVLHESQADALLFDFVVESVDALDAASPRAVANMPLCFLFKLSRFLGIEPDVSTFSEGMIFDMVDAVFRLSTPMHSRFLSAQASATVALISRMTYANLDRFNFTRAQRQEIIDGMIRYYSLHYTSLASLKSLEILRSL